MQQVLIKYRILFHNQMFQPRTDISSRILKAIILYGSTLHLLLLDIYLLSFGQYLTVSHSRLLAFAILAFSEFVCQKKYSLSVYDKLQKAFLSHQN